MCYIEKINKYKQVGIVMKEDLSIDFYYDFRLV